MVDLRRGIEVNGIAKAKTWNTLDFLIVIKLKMLYYLKRPISSVSSAFVRLFEECHSYPLRYLIPMRGDQRCLSSLSASSERAESASFSSRWVAVGVNVCAFTAPLVATALAVAPIVPDRD